MTNPGLKLAAVAICALAAGAFGTISPAQARSDAGAVAAGIIVGAAVGAAIASEHKHSHKVYVPNPAPRPAWSQTYSPKSGIWCYPAQRACYKKNGAYSGSWTYKVYGR